MQMIPNDHMQLEGSNGRLRRVCESCILFIAGMQWQEEVTVVTREEIIE